MVIESKSLSQMESFHRRKTDCVYQRKLLISVHSDELECFSLLNFSDTVDPCLTFVEFLNNLTRYCISDAIEKQRVCFRNDIVGSKKLCTFPDKLVDEMDSGLMSCEDHQMYQQDIGVYL